MQIMLDAQPYETSVAVPATAVSLAGFRKWQESPDFPEHGRIEFFDGEVLVDMSPERTESHSLVKCEIYEALQRLVRDQDVGQIYGDGPGYTNEAAGIVTQPDALFIRWSSFRDGKVHGGLPDDEPLGFIGAVDWILEVVSPSSVRKDRERLLAKYAAAGVEEYRVVDARGEEIEFLIYSLDGDEYRLESEVDGYRRSRVFGPEFRLERRRDPRGGWQYFLTPRS